MVEVKKIQTTPMYSQIWDYIEECGKRSSMEKGKIIAISNRLGLYHIIHRLWFTKKNGQNYYWIHICKPRKLHAKTNKIDKAVVNQYTNIESLKDTKCSKCGYSLTKQEQILLKLTILGEKR